LLERDDVAQLEARLNGALTLSDFVSPGGDRKETPKLDTVSVSLHPTSTPPTRLTPNYPALVKLHPTGIGLGAGANTKHDHSPGKLLAETMALFPGFSQRADAGSTGSSGREPDIEMGGRSDTFLDKITAAMTDLNHAPHSSPSPAARGSSAGSSLQPGGLSEEEARAIGEANTRTKPSVALDFSSSFPAEGRAAGESGQRVGASSRSPQAANAPAATVASSPGLKGLGDAIDRDAMKERMRHKLEQKLQAAGVGTGLGHSRLG